MNTKRRTTKLQLLLSIIATAAALHATTQSTCVADTRAPAEQQVASGVAMSDQDMLNGKWHEPPVRKVD